MCLPLASPPSGIDPCSAESKRKYTQKNKKNKNQLNREKRKLTNEQTESANTPAKEGQYQGFELVKIRTTDLQSVN